MKHFIGTPKNQYCTIVLIQISLNVLLDVRGSSFLKKKETQISALKENFLI